MMDEKQNNVPEEKSWILSHPILLAILCCILTGIVVFLSTFIPLTGYYSGAIAEYENNYVRIPDKYDVGLLEAALGLLDSNSIFELPDRAELTETMIEAVIAKMGDRYGTFFTDAEYLAYTSDLAGNFVGIGVSVNKDDDGNADVLLVHAGSPAEESGMLAGDVILSVDGIAFADGYEEAFNAIAGEAGSVVSVTVRRGGEALTFEITRASVEKQTVISRTETYNGHAVGYVLLTGFDGHTFAQFKAAVSTLEEDGVEAFVFDVRSNGGGLLSEVGKVLSYLLPDGVIAYVDYASDALSDYTISSEDGYMKSGSSTPFLYEEGGHRLTVPAAVLVNGSTASAAELFTAALRDYASDAFDRQIDVTLLGTTTYGKGTVQTTYSLGSGCALKLSLARYSPPTNVNYDGIGIEPDVTVELT